MGAEDGVRALPVYEDARGRRIAVDETAFDELKRSGIVAKDAEFEKLLEDIEAAAKPLLARMRGITALDAQELEAARKSVPAHTPEQERALTWVKAFLKDLKALFPIFYAQGRQGVPDPADKYEFTVLSGGSGRH